MSHSRFRNPKEDKVSHNAKNNSWISQRAPNGVS
jgi:hypothetical protein